MTLKERLVRFRSFWIFPLLAVLLLYWTGHDRSLSDLLWLMPIGILISTLLEYGLHRFIFHIQMPLRNPKLRDMVNASHLSHHASPRDPGKLLVHPMYGFVVSVILYGVFVAILQDGFSVAGIM